MTKTKTTITEALPQAASGDPVVIAHAYRWHEAQMAAGMLRACGIHAGILDPLTQNMMPEAGLALGGMRLVVPPSQRAEALALLQSMPLPSTRMTWARKLIFALLVWWCGAAPMMSGLYPLRRPEDARAASVSGDAPA